MLRSLLLNKHPTAFFVTLLLIIHMLYAGLLAGPGMFHTHDGELHTARIGAYSTAFKELHIPPRWAGYLNYGYGTPALIFHYPFPGYIGSVFHGLGFTFRDSYKLILFISFTVSAVGFFLWMKTFFSPPVSFAASLFYGLAPYRFLDLYVRGAQGELFAFVFIPFIFFFIEQVRQNRNILPVVSGGITYALLILSHNIFSLVFSPVFVLYAFIRVRERKHGLILFGLLLLIGLVCSAFFWIPALAEQRYTLSTMLIGKKYMDHFVTLQMLFTSSWGFGPDVNIEGGLSPQIGLLHSLIAIAGIVLCVKEKKLRWLYAGATVFLLISVFLSTSYSSLLWTRIPLLSMFEFPWRFTAISGISVAIISALLLQKVNRIYVTYGLALVLLVTSIQFVKTSGFERKPDSYYLSYEGSTDFGAATPVWTAGDPFTYPRHPVETIGEGTVTNYRKESARHSFDITAAEDVTIIDNTLYFPGWKVFVDGVKTPIEFQNVNHRGLITFAVPSGSHSIDVVFTESPVRFVSDLISATGIIAIILLLVWYRFHRKKI